MKSIKAGIFLAAAVVLSAGMYSYAAEPGEVPIDASVFPDEKFRGYVEQFDLDKNGSFSAEELEKVTEIDIYYMGNGQVWRGISDLTGIEHFGNLENLWCNASKITELDLSRNTELKFLRCNETAITELNLENNTKLELLNCFDTKLEKLDVSNNKALKELRCYNTNISGELDLRGNTNLTLLSCEETKVSCLMLPKNSGMQVWADKEETIDLTVPAGGFDLTAYFPSLEESEITVISGGKITGTKVSGYTAGEPLVYEYLCGTAKEKVKQKITVNLTVEKARNEWTKALTIQGWTEGEEPEGPKAEAKYGEVHYRYSNKADGTYTDQMPETAGIWYVKAYVDETETYKGLESDPVQFTIAEVEEEVPDKPAPPAQTDGDEKDDTVTKEDTVKTSKVPRTGDSAMLGLWGALLAASAGAVLKLKKR